MICTRQNSWSWKPDFNTEHRKYKSMPKQLNHDILQQSVGFIIDLSCTSLVKFHNYSGVASYTIQLTLIQQYSLAKKKRKGKITIWIARAILRAMPFCELKPRVSINPDSAPVPECINVGIIHTTWPPNASQLLHLVLNRGNRDLF
jgi:hypothetical protein